MLDVNKRNIGLHNIHCIPMNCYWVFHYLNNNELRVVSDGSRKRYLLLCAKLVHTNPIITQPVKSFLFYQISNTIFLQAC